MYKRQAHKGPGGPQGPTQKGPGPHKGPAHKGSGGPTRARPTRAQGAHKGPGALVGPAHMGPGGPTRAQGAHKGPVRARSARFILVYIYIWQRLR